MPYNTLSELATYLKGQAAQGGVVTLDSTFLSTRVLNLIALELLLPSQAITLHDVQPANVLLSNDGQSLYILNGLSPADGSLLYLKNVTMNVVIQQTTPNNPTGYDFIMGMALPSDWTFGDSFPALAMLQPPGFLVLSSGPFMYFSSFVADQPLPAYPPPAEPMGSGATGNILKSGLNYYAMVELAGAYEIIASIINVPGPYPMYGLIDPGPDQPQFDLKAIILQASVSFWFINATAPWLGVRVVYPTAPDDEGDGEPTDGDDGPYPTLLFYLGSLIDIQNDGGGHLPFEIDVSVPNLSAKQVAVSIVSDETTPLNLNSVAALLMNSSADQILAAAAPLSTYLGTITMERFTATFAPLSTPLLNSVQVQLGTSPPWPLGFDGLTLDLQLQWNILFGPNSNTWFVSFSALLTFSPELAFEVAVTVPNLTITGTQYGTITLSLSDLNKIFGSPLDIPEDLLTMSFTDFSVGMNVNAKTYVINGTVDFAFSLFGTPILALEDMKIGLSVNSSGPKAIYTLNFNGIVALGTIQVETTATITNAQQTDTVFTMHLVDETVGSMLNHLVHMVDPTYDISLGDPWNKLLEISLDALVVEVNVTKQTVSLTYNTSVDLGFLTLSGITLTYKKGTTAASEVTISINGTFLGQSFGAGSGNPPLAWNAMNQNPPTVPGAGASLFDLQYAGLGQHVQFDGSNATNVEAVMKGLKAAMLPTQAGTLPPFGQNSLSFSAQSNWLIGAQFSIMGTVSISAIFNDPDLYGILIALSGEKAKIFAGLKFEILYRKITDTIGVYHIELKLPDAMRTLQFGAVSVTLPMVILDIYTNGNFKVNFGFPVGLDFSNSFSLQIFPFVGYGGFYFALLDGATSSRVPQITNGTFSPVIEFGLALSLGVGKTVNAGILSGGITVTVVGIVQGVLAWFNPTDNSPKETYYWIQGTISIVGRLYATIDFAIIQATVDVTAYASVTLTIESHQPIYIAISASVSVRVKVKIVFFTIHLSFSARVDASFTIGSATPTPWITAPKSSGSNRALLFAQGSAPQFAQLRGQRTLQVAARRPARMAVALRRTLIASRLSSLQLAVFGITASEPITSWPAVTVMPGGIQTVQIWALPAFTKSAVSGKANVVMLLAAQNSVDPGASTQNARRALYGADPASATFNLLMEAMLRWGIYAETGGAPTVTLDQLLDLQTQLKDPATIAEAFDYTTLTNFLAKNFVFNVTPTTDVDNENGVAVFPMVPAITLTDTAGTSVDFGTYNEVDLNYQQKVAAYFQLLQVQFQQRNSGNAPMAALEEETSSMPEVIFGQYFNMMMSQGVQVAIDLLAQYPYTTASVMSIADIATALNDPTLVNDPMRVVSPNAELKVLNQGAMLDLPEVVHQIRLNETLSGIAADFAAMGALNASGAPYTAQDILTANLNAAGIFNVGVSVAYSGITYTTQVNDTLNLIGARLMLRIGGNAVLGAINGLSTTVNALLALNPQILDPNAPIIGIATVNLPPDAPFTAPTYAVVPGDTLTLIAGYFLGISQGNLNLSTFLSELLPLNPGLQITDPAETQPTGTSIVIPPLERAFAGGDTINSVARLLITTQNIIGTNLLAVPATTVMLAPQGVLALPLQYAVVGQGENADTFSSIAAKFDLTLETIAIQATDTMQGGAPTKIFAGDVTVTVDAVEEIGVDMLVSNLLGEAEWNNASGMVSRFMLSGLRIPDPSSTYFQNLTLEELQDPTKLAAIPTLPLFQLTGQQYPIDAPVPEGYEITLANTADVTWMNFDGADTLTFGLTADQANLLDEIATTPLSPDIETLTRLALFQMLPKRIVLQNHIAWQAAVAPPGCLATSVTTGNPSVWLFPDSLILQIEAAAAQGQALFETVAGRDVSAGQADDAQQVGCYAWGTIVDFTVTLPPTDGASSSVSNAYVIGGADDAGAALLQDLYTYLTTHNDTASLYLLYSPNPTSGNPTGLSSDQLNAASTFIVKTNLSTLTHSGSNDFMLFATADPTDVVAAPLSSVVDFITLLWEASITRSGGFYLNYINQNGGAALPPSVFNNTTEATLSLLVILDSQAASRDAAILSFNNCVVIGDNIDTTTTSVFVQPAVYVVTDGDTLTTVTTTFNSLWGTNYPVLDVATFNEAVPLLLLVGAMLTIPGQGSQYEIQYGDTLANIVAKFSLPNLAALVNAGSNATSAILTAGTQMQFAQGILQPSTTVPAGTIGFEITRTNPDPDGVPWDQLTPSQVVGSLFNMVGFAIEGEGVFIASGAGLPTTPADDLQGGTDGLGDQNEEDINTTNWYYRQTIAVAPFGTPQNGSTSAALPPAKWNPYNGVGFDQDTQKINQATISLDMQDIYGNIQALPAPYNQLDVPVGYYDDIVSLGSWPSLAMGYMVSGTDHRVHFSMTMQQDRYIPSLSVTVASAIDAIAADLTSYTTIYYQLAQPDYAFSMQTTLDSNSMISDQNAYTLAKDPFTAFAWGAYIYLAAFATQKAVQRTVSGTTTSVQSVTAQYSVPGAELFTANQEQAYQALFGTAMLKVPAMYTTVQNDTLASIAAAHGITFVNLATMNQYVPLEAGVTLLAPERTTTAGADESLNAIAARMQASAGGIADDNAGTPGLLVEGTVFTVGAVSYRLGENDTFANAALQLGATVQAVGEANQYLNGIFVDNAPLAVRNAVVVSGNTFASLAAAFASGSVETLVTGNENVENIFTPATPVEVGINSSPTPAGPADTLNTFAVANGVTPAQLGAVNDASTMFFADGAQVDIPGVLSNTSAEQYCTYTAGPGDTLENIAAKFGTTTAVITALNPGVTTVTPGSQWICPPMIGNAGGVNAARTLSGLAAAYNTDVTTLAASNAATLGVLASGVAVTIKGVSTITNDFSTLNGLLNIVLAAGADATMSDVVDAVKDVQNLIAAAAMIAPVPPSSPALNEVPVTPHFTDAVFQITVNVVATRDEHMVDPDFIGVPSVRRVSYSVPPQPDQADGQSEAAYTLTQFATALQASLPGLNVATGEPASQGDDPESANTIWGVNFGNSAGPAITYSFQGAQTQYFALPPLSTALVGGTVPIKPYVPGQGLGPAGVNQTFQGVDLDVWLNTFLSACDLMLTPAYTVPAYSIDPGDMVTIVNTKGTLAQRISERLAYVLQVTPGGSLDDAKAAMYQSLLSQLSSTFTVDTLVQVPVTVSSSYTDPLAAPRLSGKIVMSDVDGTNQSVPSAFSFSTAKVVLTQPGATATFLFSVKAPAQFKEANLDLQYVVTELELPDPGSMIGEYEGSSWLKFILPLETSSSDIGDVSIPVPLRSYPSPVTLVSQTAIQSVADPQSATDLLGWNFDFVYQHDDAEQDTPLVAATFNGVNNPLAMLGGTGGLDLNAVFAALAQFMAVWPVLKDDLAQLASVAPGTTDAVALAAVQTFTTLMQGVADAWAQNLMAAAFSPEAQTFYYQMQKAQTTDTNPTLTTLTLTSIDPTTGQPQPNPFQLWPQVYVTVSGVEQQLTPAGTPTDTQAVYNYPPGIPAGADLAQRFAYTWPDGVGGLQSGSGVQDDTGADQVFQFNAVNIFSQQSGIAGVAITRNLSLIQGTPTNPAFVYRTPLVNFTSSAIPSIFAGRPIALAGAPKPIGQSLGTFLKDLFTSHNQWQPDVTLTIRFAAAYSYALASTPGDNGAPSQNLDTLVPIALVPSYDFNPNTDWDWNDETSFVSRMQGVVDAWQAANTPVTTNGSYFFDLTVFASQGQLQPLVQATSLQYGLQG